VDFRRVRCPQHLTDISGSVPEDDGEFPTAEGADVLAPTPAPAPTSSTSSMSSMSSMSSITFFDLSPIVQAPTITTTTTTTTMITTDPIAWATGTWTTGYWDCCKPSCSWPGKGNVEKPVRSCDAVTGEVVDDPNEPSVCQGGRAATCKNNKPFNVSETLSMGFAAAATSGAHGLSGDENCGQCFELRFTEQVHNNDGGSVWGGADHMLVGKRMVVQVTNIGYDVTGDHSFDIMIPGAGQGAFSSGCTAQFAGFAVGDFDCDNRYGGCSQLSGCARLPLEFQDACNWRYNWYGWLQSEGKTNNPFVDFRRVRCPQQLTDISGSVPEDDEQFPTAQVADLLV